LWVRRGEREWCVATDRRIDLSNVLSRAPAQPHEPSPDDAVIVAAPADPPPETATMRHFAFAQTTDELHLVPSLADRTVVVGPRQRMSVVPQQEVTVYVTSPLWFRAVVGAKRSLLVEEPIVRPSDTWLGPPGGDGELCYWSQTDAILEIEALPEFPHRVHSAVRVVNRAGTPMALDRLRLPMPHMSLFAAADHRLWTEVVVLEREEDGEMTTVRLEDTPPPPFHSAVLVCEPQQRGFRRFLTSTIGGVLRSRG